ncbi:uncharacterized protein [Montipora foliosa]|uniref:uncharacterized protein n=1 Tax=Montipora foliosa TaxID=591990 RepID=UPI0035F1AE3C
MLEAVVAFIVYIVESFTASVLENPPTTPCGSRNVEDHDNFEIEPLLVKQRSTLEEFTNFDPNDTIFQEFDPPFGACGSMAWKDSRPSRWTSFVSCFRAIFLMQLIIGSSIGLLAIAVAVVDFNTADLCYEKTLNWTSMPRVIQSIRVTGQSVEGFMIELWHFSIMLCLFGYSVLKDLNLLAINLSAAFVDVTYRLCLQVFGIYKQLWMSYPLNVLSNLVVFGNSIIIAKHLMSSQTPVQQQTKKKLLEITFLLGLQFFVGVPAAFVLVYSIFPWYNRKSEMEKVFIAGACPLLLSLPKVIVRALAPKFELVHPGLLYLLVGCLYSSSAIVFRVMQAELTSFGLFVALGVGHAVIDLVERLTVTMRDYIWDFMYKILFRCNRSQTVTLSPRNSRTPRSMRFVADVSIQLLLTEPTALVTALGFSQVLTFMYPNPNDPNPTVLDLIWGFIKRCVTGLAIDVVFNTVSVWLQVTLFNVAILKVWNSHNWRAHVIANVVFTLMAVLYFTEYLFGIIRPTPKGFASNCSLPFSRNS